MGEHMSAVGLHNATSNGSPLVVLDVRSSEEYRIGHLPGAIHIPADDLPVRIEEVPIDRPVVTYCSMRHKGSSRSERAAEVLRSQGIEAHVLEGGIPAWEAAGYTIEQG